MRKITLLLSLCALFFVGHAQRTAVNLEKDYALTLEQNLRGEGDITDTLMPASFLTGTPALYSATGGGFVAGINGYGDAAKGQAFLVDEAYNVEGVMIWVGANGSSVGDLSVNILELGDMPGSSLASVTIPFAQVTTTTPNEDGTFFHTVMFDEPVTVTGDYVVSTSWVDARENSFGLISTTSGDAGETMLSWEQWSDASWYTIFEAWSGLDIDLGLFPLTSPAAAATVEVTFNVDMSKAELADGDVVYVTGSFAGWAEPGTDGSTMLSDEDADGIYTATVAIEENLGEIAYKYFHNAGWAGGDTFVGPGDNGDRLITIGTEAITLDDAWGMVTSIEEASLASVEMYPNPFNAEINLSGLNNVSNVIISNIIGQTIQTISVDAANLTVNTSDLESGIYVVTLVTENGLTRSERIVKK